MLEGWHVRDGGEGGNAVCAVQGVGFAPAAAPCAHAPCLLHPHLAPRTMHAHVTNADHDAQCTRMQSYRRRGVI